MKIPQLRRKLEVKNYHGLKLKDEYSWIHQENILDVLKDSSKLNSEVRKYLEEENALIARVFNLNDNWFNESPKTRKVIRSMGYTNFYEVKIKAKQRAEYNLLHFKFFR